jgi:hypothetical protein
MAKKNTSPEKNSSATATSAAAPARQRTSRAKRQAPAPLDISTVTGTEHLESAADMGGNSSAGRSYEPSHQEVAEAAYLRYLRRGGQSGDEFNDWVEAERELRGRNGAA